MADSAPPPSYETAKGGGQPPIAMQPTSQHPMGAEGTVTPLHHLSGQQPEWIDCQFCKRRTKTSVVTKGEGMQFLTGTLLCLVCICLAPLPCMLHWFEETQWYCTNCKNLVATRGHETPIQVNAAPEQRQVPSQYPQGQQPPQQYPQEQQQQQQQQYPQQQYPQEQQPQQQPQQQHPAAPAEAYVPPTK